jgi:ElaB/YqjD/DUF883 family membrane-anchored ribosome-binding protein
MNERQREPAGSMTDPGCCGMTQSQSQRARGLRLGDARARLDDAVRGVRAQFGQLQGTTMHRAREAIRSADETVHHHPYGALAAVAVAGLLVGLLAARR